MKCGVCNIKIKKDKIHYVRLMDYSPHPFAACEKCTKDFDTDWNLFIYLGLAIILVYVFCYAKGKPFGIVMGYYICALFFMDDVLPMIWWGQKKLLLDFKTLLENDLTSDLRDEMLVEVKKTP